MNDWEQAVVHEAAEMGFQPTAQQLSAFIKYLELLNKWNERINLVGPAITSELISFHLMDSLALLEHLPDQKIRLLDVGSGAGLPAVPIAIARQDIEVVALEPIHKKHAFISTVCRELPLANLTALTSRYEDHRASDSFAPYDVAVSRATFSLDKWLAIGADLVREGGLVLGMEGMAKTELPPGATRYQYQLGQISLHGTTKLKKRAIISLRHDK